MTGRIHDRYLLKQFVRIFLISIVSFLTIYITVDTFEEIDNFIDHEATMFEIVRFYFYSIPFILTYIIPVSLLLGTIFSMGIMARRNEITAFLASGVSLIRIAQPILVTAILVSLFSTGFNDQVVTKATRKAKDVKEYEVENRARSDPYMRENFHYLGENGNVYLARRYNHQTKTMYEVVVQEFASNTLVRRVDAKRAAWDDGTWVFYDGFNRVFTSGSEQVESFSELAFTELSEVPEDFAKEQIDPEDMNVKELSYYIEKVRKSGGNVERYATDLYFKFSYPLAGCIFVLLGIAFASGKRKQSIATGFGLTLLISFLYYGVLRIGQTLGYNGVVPPLLAAELGNLIFLIVGIGFLTKANQ